MFSKTITRIHCAHYTYLVLFIRFDTYCQPPPTQTHTTYHSQRQTPPNRPKEPMMLRATLLLSALAIVAGANVKLTVDWTQPIVRTHTAATIEVCL